jgi:uncharacterized protein
VSEFDWSTGAFADGVRLYRSGKYFEAHEAWETLWLTARQPDKAFLQGLIQVTAAFHHAERQNTRGTRLLLERALGRFERYPPDFGGVSVLTLRDDIRERLGILASTQSCAKLSPVRVVPS